ncbi:MAG: glycoside hydrolase family 16 protein [Verrucomicrobiota bacterium]|nr:glycoside hydrolase family 16 protein [Verrucomicrobiota bacterium]
MKITPYFLGFCLLTPFLLLAETTGGAPLSGNSASESTTAIAEVAGWVDHPSLGWTYLDPTWQGWRYNYQIGFLWTDNEQASGTWYFSPRADVGWLYTSTGFGTWLYLAGQGWSTIPTIVDNEWLLVWQDEFDIDGRPDPEKWGYEYGRVRGGELQYYTYDRAENAEVKDGNLVIRTIKESYNGSDYTSASLLSRDQGDWLYAKVEIRAKLPTGLGMWPALWLMPTESFYGPWPQSGEIDIMENVGFDPDRIHHTIHTENYNQMKGILKNSNFLLTNPAPYEEFHTYAMEWYTNKIQMFVDGIKRFEFMKAGPNYKTWPFDRHFYIIMNSSFGGTWGGQNGVDDTVLPQEMHIDYVRVYQQRKYVVNPIRTLPPIEDPETVPSPSGQTLGVNFAPAVSAPVAGYLLDVGLPFADRGEGMSYGWSVDISATGRERYGAISPDKRFDTLLQMQKSGNATWEMAVPNGNYSVTAVMGDAAYTDSIYHLTAEGTLLLNATPTYGKRWVVGTATVTVSDGRLTLATLTSAVNAKLCFVNITPVP